MKYIIPTLVLLASCATPPATPSPATPLNPDSGVEASPDIVQPDLADLPEDDQISEEVDEEDTNDEYCSEFLEQQGDGPAECLVLEDDEDIAIVMKTTDSSKPLSTYWAIYCHGMAEFPINIAPGIPESLHSLTFVRNTRIQLDWTQGAARTAGKLTLPLPNCTPLQPSTDRGAE